MNNAILQVAGPTDPRRLDGEIAALGAAIDDVLAAATMIEYLAAPPRSRGRRCA